MEAERDQFMNKDVLSVQEQIAGEKKHEEACGDLDGVCAICLCQIVLQETALVKGCEHAYCIMCILKWATYREKVTCPQCKHPFESLFVHRCLDGSIRDYMFPESVCLLLRATWFKHSVEMKKEIGCDDDWEDYYESESGFEEEEEEGDDLDEAYFGGGGGGGGRSVRIGNRRWGDNGYVRSGRQEARPPRHRDHQESSAAGPSDESKSATKTGRRARRALKRDAINKEMEEENHNHPP